MKKSLLCCILMIILVVNIVFAYDYEITQITKAKPVYKYSERTTVDEMDTVIFGSYPQSDVSGNIKDPIEWIVVTDSEYLDEKRTLLLSKYILDCKCYNNTDDKITWENCTLRNWLNSTFLNTAFDSSEQEYICDAEMMNSNNSQFYTYGGKDTIDKVFCLDEMDINTYFLQENMRARNYRLQTRGTEYAKSIYNNDNDKYGGRLTVYTPFFGGGSYFWLRTPGNVTNAALAVDSDGILNGYGKNVNSPTIGVRPAIWVSNIKILNSKSLKTSESNNDAK